MFPNASSFAVTKAQLNGDVGTTASTRCRHGRHPGRGRDRSQGRRRGRDQCERRQPQPSDSSPCRHPSARRGRTTRGARHHRRRRGHGIRRRHGVRPVLDRRRLVRERRSRAASSTSRPGFTAESFAEPKVYALRHGRLRPGRRPPLAHGPPRRTHRAPISDGTILAINCNGADTICFALPHGMQTGTNVSYSAPATGIPAIDNGSTPEPERDRRTR